MASSLQRQLQILLLLLILISFFISAASTTTTPPPSSATTTTTPPPPSTTPPPSSATTTTTPPPPSTTPPPSSATTTPPTPSVTTTPPPRPSITTTTPPPSSITTTSPPPPSTTTTHMPPFTTTPLPPLTTTSTTHPPPFTIPQPPDHFLYASILSTLGFTELSSATFAANLTTTTPITIFAPSDSSLLTCPSCSLPLLLQEHAIPGLYPLHFLRNLAFGTKLETTAPNRCLTITATGSSTPGAHDQKVFVNGVEITSPDLFNNGLVMVHGLQGFITHLSPISCNVERMTSLTFPPQTMTDAASFSIMRLMLKDVIVRLRNSGYSFVALALRLKSAELLELKSMTIFALDDASIFAGEGFAYLSHFRFHVVPNKRIAASELVSLPASTVLPTLETGEQLVVTTAGGGGTLAPININYVKVTTIDLMHNGRIAVHGVSAPFPHMHHSVDEGNEGGGYGTMEEKMHCDPMWHHGGVCHLVNNAEVPVAAQIGIVGDHEDHHGL